MSALAIVREHLQTRRAMGVPFDQAWSTALGRLRLRRGDADGWIETLLSTRDSWQAAYEHAPAPSHVAALAIVADGRGVNTRPACARCGATIPDGKRPQARYCSRACQHPTKSNQVQAAA